MIFFGRKRKVSDIADVWKFVSFPGLGYFEQDQPGMKRNKSISKDLAQFSKLGLSSLKSDSLRGNITEMGWIFLSKHNFFHG